MIYHEVETDLFFLIGKTSIHSKVIYGEVVFSCSTAISCSSSLYPIKLTSTVYLPATTFLIPNAPLLSATAYLMYFS